MSWTCPKCRRRFNVSFKHEAQCACGFRGTWESGGRNCGRSAGGRRIRPAKVGGAGTELKALWEAIYVSDGDKPCNCADFAGHMDRWGIDGCRTRRPEIVAWLRERASPLNLDRARQVLAQALARPIAAEEDPLALLVELAIDRAAAKERKARGPHWISLAQMTRDALLLAARLPPDAAGIVGVARSGMIPASLIAAHLHLPLFVLKHDGVFPAGSGWRIADRPETPGPLVVVDDNQVTGRSHQTAREIAGRHLAGRQLLYAVLYRSNRAAPPLPEFVFQELSAPILMEWNLWNSIYTPSLACDFDGILTVDGTAQPLYLPRRVELPLVITGRPEPMRQASLAWLARYGVRVRRLEMFPGRFEELSQESDGLLRVSRFKAEIFAKSNCRFYAESDPRQAREIAQLAGKPVVCPAAGEVFLG